MAKGFSNPDLTDIEAELLRLLNSGQGTCLISSLSHKFPAQSVYKALKSLEQRKYIYQKKAEKNHYRLTKLGQRLSDVRNSDHLP